MIEILYIACVACFGIGYWAGRGDANTKHTTQLQDMASLPDPAALAVLRQWGPNARYGRRRTWPRN